ncbi:MAG TPA: helix-hairpin-helix domain-containing protein, partial [Vicingus sp.]|nr:helix-hairpin-helix domain-containing protein [Vicingus sp.]
MGKLLHIVFCFINRNKLFPNTFLLSTFYFLLSTFPLFSQITEEEKNQIIEQRVEYLIESEESSDIDYTTIFEQLNYYYDRPLNLNKASTNELKELSLFSDIQINNLLSHIENNGKLMTLEELQTIQGFDLATIRMITPFVKVS